MSLENIIDLIEKEDTQKLLDIFFKNNLAYNYNYNIFSFVVRSAYERNEPFFSRKCFYYASMFKKMGATTIICPTKPYKWFNNCQNKLNIYTQFYNVLNDDIIRKIITFLY